MQDYADSVGALRTTVSALRAAGVDPMKITVSLIAAATQLYREEISNDELDEQDLKVLIAAIVKGDAPR